LGETDLRLFGFSVLKFCLETLYSCVFIIIMSGSMDLLLILPGKIFEKDLESNVGRAADNMRNYLTFECF